MDTINHGYVLEQLARALATAEQHTDPKARERAEEKSRKWRQVVEGLFAGTLSPGSRTPVDGVPAWATLEVAHGGFATGSLLANGPLRPHEEALRGRLGAKGAETDRTALNLHYLGDDGRAELLDALHTGRYRVEIPEEGALLTVAWLLEHGAPEQAHTLLATIAPFFDRLRFYPIPHPQPLVAGTSVCLQPLAKTAEGLRAVRQQARVLAMNEALTIWAPMLNRASALFAETVEGPRPSLRTNADGALARREDGQPYVDGGWPCRTYPADWSARARALVADYDEARKIHKHCGKPARKKENLARLVGYLRTEPLAFTNRDVGMIRKVLASVATRRATPRETVIAPTHGELRAVVLQRVGTLHADVGVPSLERLGAAVTPDEGTAFQLPVGSPMPRSVVRKLERSLEAPIEELVQRGVIPSSEVLGRVLPQITSQIRAASLTDPDARRLYATTYAAFRRRRSLLLLNLEHQVRFDELPWVAALSALRSESTSTRVAAHASLHEVLLLALSSFPQTIVPNKLLNELRALANDAGLKLAFVDELAADIFMGTFSETFLRAAQDAATLLHGTLYERYYGLPFDAVLRIDDVEKKSRYATSTSPAFEQLCRELADQDGTTRWSVAKNGTIVEQEQILTTHNLATAFNALALADRLDLGELAKSCFRWVCKELQIAKSPWKSKLRTLKNTAYAWRQMLFFLTLSTTAADDFVAWAEEHLSKRPAAFQARFAPALSGLRAVVHGGEFDTQGLTHEGGRRFLGWTTGRHWLLPT